MRRLIAIIALLCLLQICFAASVSQNEARALGNAVFTHLSGSSTISSDCEAYSGSYSVDQPDFYIVRFEPTGFVLVASEEQSIPILGYSLENKFPTGEIPAHVKWYLDAYSRGMAEIRQNPQFAIDDTWTALRSGDFSQFSISRDVSPLLSTTWDQDYPYNYYCPTDNAGPGGRVYAGCVATAMGQVMKKWNYPTTGNGSYSYYASGYGTQSANFGATTYNWASMPNSISSVNTHIATLLYHLGISVDMQYAPDGSGAYSEDVRPALVNYFRYNPAAQYRQASSYTATVWANMIRTDLDLGRPVYYSGHGADSGHAFVLDGYQGTSNFHFNWGWSGYYNGYFALTNLNPGSHNFSQYQAAVFSVYPLTQSTLTGIVTSGATGLAGVTVSIGGTGYSATTSATGYYNLAGVPAGTYQVTAAKTGYTTVTQSVTLVSGQTTTLNFTMTQSSTFAPPTNLTANVVGNNVNLNWSAPNEPPPPPEGFTDGFETYADFSMNFPPWTLVDVDGSTTYGFSGHTFPNSGSAMSYIIFNPGAVSPPLTDASVFSGSKMAASFASASAVNNDWMISPMINIQTGYNLRFWAKSYTAQYGLERFKVGVSTGGTALANFTIISGANYIQAPVDWTQYSYNLSAYAGQDIRVAIQCVSNDAFIFFVDDVSVGNTTLRYDLPLAVNNSEGKASRSISSPVPGPLFTADTRNLLGYKVYRNGNLISTLGSGTTAYSDMGLANGNYSYTVTAYYSGGESDPAGPANVNITTLTPPQNLTASVDMNDVTLQWTSPITPPEGEWISWSNNDLIDNSIGTNAAAVFDVAHMYDSTELAGYQGAALAQMKFVPAYDNCIYTVKIWTGGTATTPGSLVYSAVAQNVIVGEWNLHILTTPVPIPSTRLWIGYEVNTQGGYPAGCDNGPHVQGKGNIMNFGGWTTLTQLAPTLTYNWQIQGFVVTGGSYKAIAHKAIAESPKSVPTGTLMANRFQPARNNRALLGYRVYRNGSMIGSINDPGITTYTDMDRPNGTYLYGVTAYYSEGESSPATVNATVNVQLGPTIFEDGFESYPNFALTMAPWTLIDQDLSATYGFQGITFPNSEAAMAYIVFNPGATTPPITDQQPYAGAKMAASFAAVNPPNSDWMVTPRLNLGSNSNLKFYARSHTAQYGLERFRVGVSTSPTVLPQMFNYITGTSYVQVPTSWTEYIYDLSAYDNQQVYIGIRCVSDDAYVFYVDGFSVHSVGGGGTSQQVALSSGWNLTSLNVSPTDHALPAVLGNIAASVAQIKGTDGVFIPGNPYSSLTSLTDGKAYSIRMNSAATWSVTGTQIPASTPIPLASGWNMAAYLPQSAMPVATAMQSISTWLQQVKGQDGVYIPNNPYSSLSTMYPGKGYWIQINSAHQLVYPTGTRLANTSVTKGQKTIPEPTVLPQSMTLLARCDWAEPGDILLAKVGDELRGAEELIDLEGFPAALLQIYCDTADEALSLWIMKPDGALIPISNRFSSMPQASLGHYPEFIVLHEHSESPDSPALGNALLGSYPNPFNPSTTISFSIAEDDTPVSLNIYNMRGQRVARLLNDNYSKGLHQIVWNGTDQAGRPQGSGLYIIELQAGSYRKTAKTVLSK